MADNNTYEKAAKECKRVGEEIADFLLNEYHKKTIPLDDPSNLKAARFEIDLPLREDFPRSKDDYADWMERLDASQKAMEDAIAANKPAYLVKQLIDDRWKTQSTVGQVEMVELVQPDAMEKRRLTVDITALRLGDYLFIGLPGESMVEMSEFLRSNFTGVKTIPVDKVNGYHIYFATPTSITLGGYTYWQRWFSREAIPVLKDRIMELMKDF